MEARYCINGEGFFVLGNPIGRENDNQALTYTRDGSFPLDRLGVTTDVLPLLGEGQTTINTLSRLQLMKEKPC